MCVAVLGVGEAGACLVEDLLAAGAVVQAWDPRSEVRSRGLPFADGPAEAVAGSDLVLSVNTASAASDAARSAAPALRPGAVYADLNTAAPRAKRSLAELVEPSGALFADVALMAPVPGRGVKTPALACGPGAAEYARLLEDLGGSVEVIDGPPGTAAARKLLRSVFMKGLAAAAIESLRAAEAAGCAPWLRDDIAATLDGPGEPLLDRLLEGSARHAGRRAVELDAAADLLHDLGVEPRIVLGARAWLGELAAGRDALSAGDDRA